MRKHSFKEWLIAVRPWSFPASAMPVLVTLVYLYWMQIDVNWVNGLLALVGIVIFHASGNAWSDYFDFKQGVDTPNTYGVKTLTSGLFTPKEIYYLALGLLAVAALLGGGLVFLSGLPLVWIGLGGVVCSLFYPWLKFRAWGDVVILMAYALLPTLGTSYAATGVYHWGVLWVAVPVGFITVAILHANNTRDIATDAEAGITTLAMKLGARASVFLYIIEILFPFVWIVGCVVGGIYPGWTLLTLLVLIPALANARISLLFPKGGMGSIGRLDEMTAKLQLLFSLVFAISFVLSAWLS